MSCLTRLHPRTVMTTLFTVALAGYALLVPSCAWDGHFDVLGYTTKPNYDTRYRTIKVPICKNRTYWTVTPVPGMEMDLQRAIVREIQTKTPYKIAQEDADTELVCTIVGFQKNLLNFTPFNTVREAETTMTVELYWRDLRTGEILTRKARRAGDLMDSEERQQPLLSTVDTMLPAGSKPLVVPSTPTAPGSVANALSDENPVDPVTRKKAIPVVVRSTAHFRPELGESITTAMQRNIDRIAVQIVSVLEQGW